MVVVFKCWIMEVWFSIDCRFRIFAGKENRDLRVILEVACIRTLMNEIYVGKADADN